MEDSRITTGALHTGVKILTRAFCGKNHFHDKCYVVTDISERRRIIYEKKLCYKCLSSSSRAANTNWVIVKVKDDAIDASLEIIIQQFV